MPVIDIIFLLMYTMKITLIIINQKILLFVGWWCPEEVKRVMIYFETKHKRISIHVFLISLAQAKIERCK